MKTPEVITDCLKAMQDAVDIPVTVKTRIGVDDLDDFEYTKKIVQSVYVTGSRHIILHARKAWLNGLSPKEKQNCTSIRLCKGVCSKRGISSI